MLSEVCLLEKAEMTSLTLSYENDKQTKWLLEEVESFDSLPKKIEVIPAPKFKMTSNINNPSYITIPSALGVIC